MHTPRPQRWPRRAMLKWSGLGLGGLTLPDVLRCRAGAAPSSGHPPDTAVIHVFLGGGPSHIDTFDLKPAAPAEIRGEFQPIATCLPGVQICEHLPRLAETLDRLAIVRSAAHSNASHLPASHWMVTGHQPPANTVSNVNPYCGAVAARVCGPRVAGLPAYVSIPRRQLLGGAAYLGAAYNPFTTESDPNARDYAVRNLTFPGGLDAERLDDRRGLLAQLDRLRRDVDRHGQMAGLDKFSLAAVDMVTNARAQEAFDIAREAPAVRDRYGRTPGGQACLLARRLVEAGVTFVTVLPGGQWDTHANNFVTLKNNSLPMLDRALSALVGELYERGLDRRVLVMVSGEFGRTPTINPSAGRDHWPGAATVLFAGGGIRAGQVIGATDRKAAAPVTHPYSPGDVLATAYRVLGIDPRQTFVDGVGRHVPILPEGTAIGELWG